MVIENSSNFSLFSWLFPIQWLDFFKFILNRNCSKIQRKVSIRSVICAAKFYHLNLCITAVWKIKIHVFWSLGILETPQGPPNTLHITNCASTISWRYHTLLKTATVHYVVSDYSTFQIIETTSQTKIKTYGFFMIWMVLQCAALKANLYPLINVKKDFKIKQMADTLICPHFQNKQ